MKSRQAVVDLVKSWDGLKESDGSYKKIIDIYNSYSGKLPRNTKMVYGWPWCACTWSALAIALGYTDIMPLEISCPLIIEEAKKMGCWVESDSYVPQPGDAVLYDWQDNGVGDNTGSADHIGTVIESYPSSGYFVVEEGNYSTAKKVAKRTMSVNGRYIRGFIVPKYDIVETATPGINSGLSVTEVAREVIAGKWGDGDVRKQKLTVAGYDAKEVQAEVNRILNTPSVKPVEKVVESTAPAPSTSVKAITATCKARNFDSKVSGTYVTTDALYCRNDAGTNKKALCLIPKGTKVKCYGYYTTFNGVKWLYIQFTLNGIVYTGFSSNSFLTR